MGLMKKRRIKKSESHHAEAISWLPIDSRLFPFLSFSHVKGVARIFLIVEMSLSVFMVVASLVLVLLHVISR